MNRHEQDSRRAGEHSSHPRERPPAELETKGTPDQLEYYRMGDVPPEVEQQFLQNVVEWENVPYSTYWEQLQKRGVELPPADQLDDAALHEKLWELIHQLAELRVFLSQTDHVSDRQLYRRLVEHVLHEPTKMLPPESGWNCHLDLLGGCSQEDLQLYLKYYADEEERQRWAEQWPEDEIPPHEDPPYDRDRLLPLSPV